MALKSRSFEGHTISMIQGEMNEFLQKIDEKDYVDMRLVVSKPDPNQQSVKYAAVIIYKEKPY